MPNDECYKELAVAIVKAAVKDYIKTLQKLMRKNIKNEKRKGLTFEKKSIEHFFYSSWFEFLVDIDPDHLIKECCELAAKKEKKRLKGLRKVSVRGRIT